MTEAKMTRHNKCSCLPVTSVETRSSLSIAAFKLVSVGVAVVVVVVVFGQPHVSSGPAMSCFFIIVVVVAVQLTDDATAASGDVRFAIPPSTGKMSPAK